MSNTTANNADQRQNRLNGARIAAPLDADEPYDPGPALAARGATYVRYPCIRTRPNEDHQPLRQALQTWRRSKYTWIMLPTTASALVIAQLLQQNKRARSTPPFARMVAFNFAAQYAARDLFGEDVATAGLETELARAEWLADQGAKRVILPLPAGISPLWEPARRGPYDERNIEVRRIHAYRGLIGSGGDDLPAMLWEGSVDAILFLSAEYVRYFATRIKHEGGTLAMLDDVLVGCIDDNTAEAAQTFGLRVDVVPQQPAPDALYDTVAAHMAA